MKQTFVFIFIVLFLVACSNDRGSRRGAATDLTEKLWRVKNVDGNQIILSNNKRVTLLGISDIRKVETYLEGYVGKKVRFHFDSEKTPRSPSRLDEYWGYVTDENGMDLNAALLQEKISDLNTSFLVDSLEKYRNIASGDSPMEQPAAPKSGGSFSVEKAKKACFLVETYSGGRKIAEGSGFFVSGSGIGVSNHHVFDKGDAWTVRLCGNEQVYEVTEVYNSSKNMDFVVFQTDASGNVTYLDLENSLPTQGDKVFVYGNPDGLTCTLSDGIVSAIRGNDSEYIQITAPISPGSSGSPVMNEAGRAIGIATSKKIGCENCNFAMNISVLNGKVPMKSGQ